MQLQQIVQSIPDNYYDELAVQALQKHRNERTAVEIFYMTKYFRQFHFFHGYSDDVVKDCCSKMRYEVLNKCFLIYKRFEQIQEDTKKLYIILQGELGVYLSKGLLPENWKDVEYDQVCTIKSYQHFGNQLFQMTKDDIHEQFGLIIRPKRLTCAATINYQFFQAYLLQLEQRKLSYEISRLYDYPVFSGIQYKELKVSQFIIRKFYINCYKYRYNYMEKVYNQGDGAFCVHFIVKGNFSLKRTIDNETISLGILSDGEVIGEHEIITNCESRPFSVTCISESGELIACDAQFFQGYVYDLIRENIEQAIEAKTKFHQLEKTSIKQELNQLHSLVVKRTSFSEICKQNKTHYPVNPKRKKTTHTTHEYKGKQSYYDLFMDIYDTASKQTKLADDDRQRRITHYVKNTLKPMQQKLKHSLNISANKTDESVNKNNAMPLHNEILIQALSRKTDSRFRRTFQKTKSLASLSPVKKSLPEIPTVDLGQHFFKNNQSTITDIHFEKLQRPDLLYSRNQSNIQQCVQLLMKDPTIRLDSDNEKLSQMFRAHEFFRISDNEFLMECCQLMRFEQFSKNQIMFQKHQLEQNRLILIISGDVVLNKGKQEMAHLKHFGSNLLILGSECYADIPDWNVTSKTNCKVATISRHDFKVNLMSQEVSRVTREISLLYTFPIFKNIPYAKVRKYYANSISQLFSCLDIVYLQEQAIKAVYLVVHGIFELRELEKGIAKAVHIFTQGQFIGDCELLRNSTLRNGTAFCISEEGQLLLFDANYYTEQVLPEIKENLPKPKSPKAQQKEKFSQKISLTGEINAKKTVGRLYNFRRSSEQNDEQPRIKQLIKQRSNLSINSVHISQSIHQDDTNQSQNQPTKPIRQQIRSNHLLIDSTNAAPNNSPKKVNRSTAFQQSLAKFREQAALKQQQQPNLRMPLKNELLNKFLNRKEEYGDIAAKNKMRRTLSQTSTKAAVKNIK